VWSRGGFAEDLAWTGASFVFEVCGSSHPVNRQPAAGQALGRAALPAQALLAGVGKLVDEIPFESNVAGRQMREEEFGDAVSLLEQAHQELLTPSGKASNRLSR
jgi:hypothetical protein